MITHQCIRGAPDFCRYPGNLKTLYPEFLAGTPAITITRAWINNAVFTPFLANIQALLFLLVLILTGYYKTAGFRFWSCLGGIFRKVQPWAIILLLSM